MTAIKKHNFKAKSEGPHILFTGRVHGNEPAGEIALKRLIYRLENKEIALTKGEVTILSCCNPEAAKENKRFIDINLNRIFSRELAEKHKDLYESALACEIMTIIDDCDMSVDLHTVTENMNPFVICLDDKNNQAKTLAESAGIRNILCDSPLLAEPGRDKLLNYSKNTQKPAILIECGQHADQESIETAWHAILNILIAHNMVEGRPSDPLEHDFLIMEAVLHHREGEKLVYPLMEKDILESGDALFEKADGTIIRAEKGGVLLMRNPETPVNEEYAFVCSIHDNWP